MLDGLKKTIAAVGEQLSASSAPGARAADECSSVSFTTNFQEKAKQWGLSEKDALDVFYHGKDRKPQLRCRTYNGYELCIYYGHNTQSGRPYISTIWKRAQALIPAARPAAS